MNFVKVFQVHLIIIHWIYIKTRTVVEDSQTTHLVRGNHRMPHNLNQCLQFVLITIGSTDFSNVLGWFFGLLAPLQLKLYQICVDNLLGCKVDNGLIFVWTFVNQIAIVGGEVDDLDIGGDIFEYFALDIELSVGVKLS